MQAGTPTERQRRQENSIKLRGNREDRHKAGYTHRKTGGRKTVSS
jgi:hypothetical protein